MKRVAVLSAAAGIVFAQAASAQHASTDAFVLLHARETATARVKQTLHQVCAPLHGSDHTLASLATNLGLRRIVNPNAGKTQVIAGRTLTPPKEAWSWRDAPSVIVAEEHITPSGTHGCNIVVVGDASKPAAAAAGKFAEERNLVGRRVNTEAVYYQGASQKRPAMLVSERPQSSVISYVGQIGRDGS